MKKKQKSLKIKVLFNASVVLSGINSPKGGSAYLFKLIKTNKIDGIISEIIFDEILKHSAKFGLTKESISNYCVGLFASITPAPTSKEVDRFQRIVIDEADAHVLASCSKEKVNYLVTLDKKHLLILKGKIKNLNIVTPGELIKKIITHHL